jgi:hypothetical protein
MILIFQPEKYTNKSNRLTRWTGGKKETKGIIEVETQAEQTNKYKQNSEGMQWEKEREERDRKGETEWEGEVFTLSCMQWTD